MIPDTAAAFLAFLGLVAPGLVYQLRREAHRPQRDETTFREVSRVALTSLIFTAVALPVVSLLADLWSALPDLERWLDSPHSYPAHHIGSVALFLGLEVALACLLATIGELATRTDQGEITDVSVYYTVLRRDVPPGAVRTWVWITTEDGTQFKGGLRAYTPGGVDAQFAIALGGQPLQQLRPNTGATQVAGPHPDGPEEWTELTGFDVVVVPGASIRHLAVAYLAADGTRLAATGASSGPADLGRLRDRWRALVSARSRHR